MTRPHTIRPEADSAEPRLYAITFTFQVAASDPDGAMRTAMETLVAEAASNVSDDQLRDYLLSLFGECEIFGHEIGTGFGLEIKR